MFMTENLLKQGVDCRCLPLHTLAAAAASIKFYENSGRKDGYAAEAPPHMVPWTSSLAETEEF
jgi:hypothetical protein